MLYYQTEFGCKRTSSLEDLVKNSHILIIYVLIVTLTLKIVNQFFHKAHWLMIIHHNTKFEKKKGLTGSGNTAWTQLDTQRKYHQDKHSLTFWTFVVTLTLNAAIPFSTGHFGLWWCSIKPSLVANRTAIQKIQRKQSYFDYALAVTLTLNTVNQFFFMRLWLMLLHYNPRAGNKMFCGSEDTIWTNIHRHFEPSLWPWPWTQSLSHFHLPLRLDFHCLAPTGRRQCRGHLTMLSHPVPPSTRAATPHDPLLLWRQGDGSHLVTECTKHIWTNTACNSQLNPLPYKRYSDVFSMFLFVCFTLFTCPLGLTFMWWGCYSLCLT